jgi:hypothetical protein
MDLGAGAWEEARREDREGAVGRIAEPDVDSGQEAPALEAADPQAVRAVVHAASTEVASGGSEVVGGHGLQCVVTSGGGHRHSGDQPGQSGGGPGESRVDPDGCPPARKLGYVRSINREIDSYTYFGSVHPDEQNVTPIGVTQPTLSFPTTFVVFQRVRFRRFRRVVIRVLPVS